MAAAACYSNVSIMKGETAEQVAERMRAIAASMSDNEDAAEIRRYANWLQRQPADRKIDYPTGLRLWPRDPSRKAPDKA